LQSNIKLNDDLCQYFNKDLSMEKILKIGVASLVLIGALHTANAYEITCPIAVKVKSAQFDIDSAPDGWEVSEKRNERKVLNAAGIYSDKPVKLIQLKPEVGIIDGKKYESTWSVNTIYDKEGNWISCGYNSDEVQLIKKIDPSMKSCWMTSSKDQFDNPQIVFKCSTSELQEIH
jgi:hypothetical protein